MQVFFNRNFSSPNALKHKIVRKWELVSSAIIDRYRGSQGGNTLEMTVTSLSIEKIFRKFWVNYYMFVMSILSRLQRLRNLLSWEFEIQTETTGSKCCQLNLKTYYISTWVLILPSYGHFWFSNPIAYLSNN